MKLCTASLLCGLLVGSTGCDIAGDQRVEQNISASCRRWDAAAQNAAHPDAATIARHDQLAQKAAEQKKAVLAQQLHGAALTAAVEPIVQAELNAAALYDAPEKQRLANECWARLGIVREIHAERDAERSIQMLRDAGDSLRNTGDAMLSRPRPTLTAPPPAPPAAPAGVGLSGLSDLYTVQHAQSPYQLWIERGASPAEALRNSYQGPPPAYGPPTVRDLYRGYPTVPVTAVPYDPPSFR